jgi:vancomycin resistance protein VanJ
MPVKKSRGPRAASAPSQTSPDSPVPGQPPFLLNLATLLYALPLLIILVANILGPEDWWPTGFNLYMPQWIWLFPLLLLLPWYAWRSRRWLWLPLLLGALVVGPIMGLSVHPLRHAPASDKLDKSEKGVRLRVMTYNIKWAKRDAAAIARDVQDYKPDVMLLQDSGGVLGTERGRFLEGWNVLTSGQYTIASHLPLTDGGGRWISYPAHNHHVMRSILSVKGREIVLYSCHLESPRFGLAAMKHPRAGLNLLKSNVDFRVRESQRLAEYVRGETLPLLLCGDLNAPAQAIVCKNLFAAGLEDAFSAAGNGYGYTYGETTKVGRSYFRIDHIMTSSQWQALDCWVGNDAGSDHCPVFADLYLP